MIGKRLRQQQRQGNSKGNGKGNGNGNGKGNGKGKGNGNGNGKGKGKGNSRSPSGMTSKKSKSNRRSFDSDTQRRVSALRMTLLRKSVLLGIQLQIFYLGSSVCPVMVNLAVWVVEVPLGWEPPRETVYSPGRMVRVPLAST